MTVPVVIALGSNLGDRALQLRRALDRLRSVVAIAKVSRFHDTDPVDSPAGSPRFLNAVCAGITSLPARELLGVMLDIERDLGRRRTGVRNAPRVIDLDLILYGGCIIREKNLVVPHPRYLEREFVLAPLRELALGWVDPASGKPIDSPRVAQASACAPFPTGRS